LVDEALLREITGSATTMGMEEDTESTIDRGYTNNSIPFGHSFTKTTGVSTTTTSDVEAS